MNAMKFGSAIHGQKHFLGGRGPGSLSSRGGHRHFSATRGGLLEGTCPSSTPGRPRRPLEPPRPLGATLPQAAVSRDRGRGLRGPETRLCLPDPHPCNPLCHPTPHACFSAPQVTRHVSRITCYKHSSALSSSLSHGAGYSFNHKQGQRK